MPVLDVLSRALDRCARYSIGQWFIVLIVMCAFLLRFAAYDNPLGDSGGDAARDYLAAYHAVAFGEWPIIGPPASGLRNLASPLYWYVVALPALVWNADWFVNLAFILLQTWAVYGIFLIGRTLFNERAGIIAAAIAALAPMRIEQSALFVWQPFVMEPFLIFAVYLGARGYRESDARYLYGSIVALAIAYALHMSVLGMLLPLLLVPCIMLYRLGGRRAFLHAVAVAAASFLVLYAPFLLHLFPPWSGINIEPAPPVEMHSEFHLAPRLDSAINGVVSQITPYHSAFVNGAHSQPLRAGIVISIAALVALMFASRRVALEHKWIFVFLSLAIGMQVCAAAIGAKDVEPRYVLPAGWASLVMVGGLAALISERSRAGFALVGALGVIVIFVWVHDPYVQRVLANISAFDRPQQRELDRAVASVITEVRTLQREKGYPDYRFFSFFGVRVTGDLGQHVQNGIFIYPVEQKLGIPLVRRTSPWHRDFDHIGANPYVFLFCVAGKHSTIKPMPEPCLEQFRGTFPNNVLVKTVHESPVLNVYLTFGNF